MRPTFRIKITSSLFSILLVLLVHFINYLYTGSMIHTTADDASYLRPAENWIASGTWKENFEGASSYVQRPPLTGIQHGIFHAVSPAYSDVFTFILAIALHGIAVFVLSGFLLRHFSRRTAWSGILTYILLPVFWGFVSYRITEAFAVSLVTIFVCILFNPRRSFGNWLALACVIWLFRPVLLLLFLPALFGLFRGGKRKIPIKQYFFISVLLGSVVFWEVRKAHYLDRWLDPHPIYAADNETMFRPAHFYLTDLFRVWEVRPENLHRIAGSLWRGDSTVLEEKELKNYIQESHCPLNSRELKKVLVFYREAAFSARESFGKGGETAVEKRFDEFCKKETARTIRNNKFQYFVSTPLRSAKTMFTKSQLNLELFQSYWRGNLLVEILRYLCLLFILAGIPATIISIVLRNPFRLLAIGGALYMFYLFWFQRLNEDRYMIVLMPVFLVLTISLADRFVRKRVARE